MSYNLRSLLAPVASQARKAWPAFKARLPNVVRALRIMRTQASNAAQPAIDRLEGAAKAHNRKHILGADFKAAARNPNAAKRTWVSDKAAKSTPANQPPSRGPRR